MSALQFLTQLLNGKTVQRTAITVSSGAPDANLIAATDTNGKWHPSLMPPGVEIQTETATVTEALDAGDFVNIFDNLGTPSVRKAVANDETKFANGFVVDAFAVSATATIYTKGVNTVVTVTPGERYFLSATVPGEATLTAVAQTTGNIHQVLGSGVTSGLIFEFDDYILFMP